MKNVFISGVSSDIGTSLASILVKSKDVQITGTYNTNTENVERLASLGVELIQVDFNSEQCIETLTKTKDFSYFDALMLLHGTLNPIGRFDELDIGGFESSLRTNCLSILSLLNKTISLLKPDTRVITLAGGGVNGATVNFSAYTISKIALIKMTELLSAEFPELLFFNLGPGFVDTKIHRQTLDVGIRAGQAYTETSRRYKEQDFVPMNKVIDALTFLIFEATKEFSGRNYSAASDDFRSSTLRAFLKNNENAYKLRRDANSYMPFNDKASS